MSIIVSYLYVYALLLLSGAYFGMKAGSRISLIMGIASGLLTLAGLLIYHSSPQFGKPFLITLTLALSIVFVKRLVLTKKLMPAGILCLFSILAVLASVNLN